MAGKKLDYSLLYGFSPTYIHSHLSRFDESLEGIEDQKSVLNVVLEELKKEIIKEIRLQYNYFYSLEIELVQALQQKDPINGPKNREDFIKKFQRMNEIFNWEDAHVNKITNIRTKIEVGKLNEQVASAIKKVFESILNTTIKNLPILKTKGTAQEISENQKQIAHFKDQLQEMEKKAKRDSLKEIKEILKKREAEIKKVNNEIIPTLNELISYIMGKLSLHYINGEEEKTAVITSYQKTIDMYRSILQKDDRIDWGTTKKGKIGKEEWLKIQKDIPTGEEALSQLLRIAESDPEYVIRHFTIMKRFALYDEAIDNFQFPQLSGNIFESLIRDTIHQVIATAVSSDNELLKELSTLFINAKQVDLGVNAEINYEKVSTIDIETHQIEKDTIPVFFGSSLKLKEGDQNVTLERTPIADYMKNLEKNLGGNTYQKMQYIRKNLIALNIFFEREEEANPLSAALDKRMDLLDNFEREIIFLSIIVRFLIGFIRKNTAGEGAAYTSVDMSPKNGPYGKAINNLYLTNFIITQDHVYSTVDILGFVLKVLEKDGSSLKETNIEMKLDSRRDFSSSKSLLEDLAKLKKKSNIRLEESMNYSPLLENGEILTTLNKLNNIFGISSYTAATMNLNRIGLKNIFGSTK